MRYLEALKKELVAIGKRVYERGYVASNDGNISVRIDKNSILMTPTGVSKGFMKPQDLLIVDTEGNLIAGKNKPSSESNMHIQIYKDRHDVNSVCHAHPPYATAFAVAGMPLDKMILPEAVIVLGKVPVVEYGTPSTKELYNSISKYILDFDAFLLANHGAVTVGHSLLNAYHKMETVEHTAKIQFIAMQIGRVGEIDKKQVVKLIGLREKFGIPKNIGLIPVRRKSKG
jgi:L-fuculose-phosphate aldolase